MDGIVSALILAFIQGFTEWLPISSSGHLVLFEYILNFKGGLLFEISVHLGTLMAVFVYFGKDISNIIREVLSRKWQSEDGKTGLFLIIGTVPAGIFGFFLKDLFDIVLSNLIVVAVGFAITGLLLIIMSLSKKRDTKLTWKKALLIGLAQAIAIVPGISRSGSTISAGVLLGLSEKAAMRFSFLLAIPVILGASFVSIGNSFLPVEFIWATIFSFVVGLLAIHLMFKYLGQRRNFIWFGIYCLILSLVIMFWVLF